MSTVTAIDHSCSEEEGSANGTSLYRSDSRLSRLSELKAQLSTNGRLSERRPYLMFADAEAMKDNLRKQMLKEDFDVTRFYQETGHAQFLARHPLFEKLTLMVIAFNAVWIGIDADYNDAEVLIAAAPVWIIMENFFCVYFSAELCIRFLAFQVKRNCVKDAWFVFDASLVFFMVLETWVLTLALLLLGMGSGNGLNTTILRMGRLMRLTRMARMARLLRMMPELLVLIKGMVAAVRSVFFTLTLLAILTYVFAIAFKSLAADMHSGRAYFHSIPAAIHSLIVYGVFLDDLANTTNTLKRDAAEFGASYLLAMFYVFVLLSALTVMNMLIGVLVEVVSAVSATEKEQNQIVWVKDRLHHIMTHSGIDKDGDNQISELEFKLMLENREATKCLSEVGVDVVGLVDLADMIFDKENTHLSFADFMEVILNLRGSNTATVKDIVDLRKFVRNSVTTLQDRLQSTTRMLERISPPASPASPRPTRRSRSPERVERQLSPLRLHPMRTNLGAAQLMFSSILDEWDDQLTAVVSKRVPLQELLDGLQRELQNLEGDALRGAGQTLDPSSLPCALAAHPSKARLEPEYLE